MTVSIVVLVALVVVGLITLGYRSIKPVQPDLFDSAAWEQVP